MIGRVGLEETSRFLGDDLAAIREEPLNRFLRERIILSTLLKTVPSTP